MKEVKTISEAAESNAGDDFHVLWTLKKSLDLLNFEDMGLKAIYVEGVERKLSSKIDTTGEKLLGVDLIEYYGGESFTEARKVVISQLKYSTRRIDQNLSFSELYKGKKSDSTEGSIINRLASIYKTLTDEFGEQTVAQKVNIKLISNRKFNESQLKLINNLQSLINLNNRISFLSVSKAVKTYKNPFNLLFKATELSKSQFVDFLKLLDFTQCGVDHRSNLEQQLILAIGNTSVTSENQFNSLYKMIWDKMMPNSKHDTKITYVNIIANLGFKNGSIENLFPVSQNFEKLQNAVTREQLNEILEIIEKNKSGIPICIHGGAGIGKSTITKQIENNLPDFSECIVFDCYGGGAYLDSEDKRHLHKYALQHISNEIAKRLGTPFLLAHNESDEVYIKELKKRIVSAVAILKSRNQNAFLTIIIDAADNSITAAEKNGEKSFVRDLLSMNIPDSCNIIVTTRTYRKETLGIPDNHINIELKPFSLIESEQFLKFYFPKSTPIEVNEFHDLTGGIPRVQSYSIDLRSKGINEVINYLKPNGKKVEDIIEEKINEAINRIGQSGKKQIDDFFKYLITLPRPVPINYLQEASAMSEAFIKDLTTDIWHGLIYENNHINFRDEDFENYIRLKYSVDLNDLEVIAKLFLSKAENDEYASIGLGNILLLADEKEELKNIVLNRTFLKLPHDPIRNKEVYINRTKSALRVCSNDDDIVAYFKLIFIAAEESKTDKALTNLLVKYPDLVTKLGNKSSIARLNQKSDEQTWAGSFHLKLAGIYSREIQHKQIAIRHLKTARNWLNWKHSSIEEDEYRNYPISSLDIAYQTEAILRLYGAEKAVNSINSWTPKSILLSSGEYLSKNILIHSTDIEIKDWIKNSNLRIDFQIFIICKLFKFGKKIDYDLSSICIHLHKILSKKIVKFETSFNRYIIEFCEIISYYKKCSNEKLIEILNLIEYKKTTRIPIFFKSHYNNDDGSEMDLYLRIITLKASLSNTKIDISELYPKDFTAIEKIEDYEKRQYVERELREFNSFFKYVLSIYQFRANRMSFVLNENEYRKSIEEVCSKIKQDWDFKYTNGYHANERLLSIYSLLIDCTLLLSKNEKVIATIISSFEGNVSKLKLRFSLLEKIAHLSNLNTLTLTTLHELDVLIEDSDLSANQITDYYIECTIRAMNIGTKEGKFYFDKAILSVSDIDYEAMHQIICLKNLSDLGIQSNDPKLAYQYGKFIEYCDIKLGDYDKDHFPYDSGLMGISNMDAASMFAISCRWHHRGIINIQDYITTILKTSLEKGYIDHIIAGSLVPICNYYSENLIQLYKLIFAKYDNEGDLEKKSTFVNFLFRDLQLSKNLKMLQVIYDEIKSGRFVHQQVILDIKNYIEFRENLIETKTEEYTNNFNSKDYVHNIDLSKLNITSTKEIEKAIKQIASSNEDYNSKWRIDNFLEDILSKINVSEYINHLDSLVDIDSNILDFYSFKDALQQRLQKWDFHPLVKEWKKNKFRYVLLNWFDNFNDYNLSIYQISEFAEMFSVDDNTLAETILSILPEKIEQLSDESIYSSIELIKNKLTVQDNEEIIRWVLDRWTLKLKSSVADGDWSESLMPPDNSIETIGNTLRFILGHPDKRIRWRGIHSLRRLAKFDNIAALEFLINNQNKRDCFPFQNKTYLFYWISAKLYLWIAIERISIEKPENLIAFKESFLKELINTDPPHVLIKYFIKKTCLNLYAFDSSCYTLAELNEINQTLVSAFEMVEERKLTRAQRKYNSSSDKDWRFKFDTMDTLPYWYSSLADWFNLSEYDVADIADKYIVESWGYNIDNPNEDYIRKTLSDRDWYKLDKRHGNVPTIEDINTYYEYHAMFCAANVLLEKEPMVSNEYSIYDNWELWLKSKANTWGDFWLSDSRDPLPQEKKYWEYENEIFDKNWRDNINETVYDEAIGLLENSNLICPYSYIRKYIGPNYETTSIRSALVSIKGSDALLRAFQTAKDSHDYAVPFENDYDRFRIKKNGFSYNGWLQNINSEKDGLDSHDPFASKNCKNYVKFGECVEKLFTINYSNNFKTAKHESNLVSSYYHWDEITDIERDRRYGTELESSAGVFKVEKSFLLSFLNKINRCLIIECRITRELGENRYGRSKKNKDEDEDIEKENVKIYLIKPDGTVKTIRGKDYFIG